MGLYIASYGNGGYKAVIVGILLIVMQILMVSGRLLSRKLQNVMLGSDDYVLILAMVFTSGLCVMGCVLPRIAGVGQLMEGRMVHNPSAARTIGQSSMAWQAHYGIAVSLSKCAILLLYTRVFTTRRRSFTIAIYIVGAVVVATGLANTFEAVFQCTPIAYKWNKSISGGKCLDEVAFDRYISISNVVTGVVMVLMPLPLVWELNIMLRQKIALTLTFLHGIIGFIASCLRLSLIFQTNAMTDTRYTAVVWTIWTMTEPANYVIAACLPTLRPVLTRILPEKMFVLSKSRNTSNKPYTSKSIKVSWSKGHVAPKLELIPRDAKSHMTGPWDPTRLDNSRSRIVGDGYSMQSIDGEKAKGAVVRTEEV